MGELRMTRLVAAVALAAFSVLGCDAGDRAGSGAGHPPVERSMPRLDRALEAGRELVGTPGVSAAVVFADGSRWAGASGKADVRSDRPVTRNTPFAVASVSKTFVAALALQLAAEGVLDLDVPVARWVPGLANARRITMRMLLGHTGGVADTPPRVRGHRWTPRRALAEIGAPICDPAACFRYSDANYVAAAAVIEAITGERVATLVRDRFLEPLGLRHTWFQQVESDRGTTATGYRDGRPERSPNGDVPSTEFVTRVGYSGAVASTARDLATWGRALFGGDVLEPASRRAMVDFERTARLRCPEARTCSTGYGLGAGTEFVSGWPTWNHSGSTGALVAYFPVQRVTIAVVSNGSPGIPPGPFPALEAIASAIPELRSVPQLFEVRAASGRRVRWSTGVDSQYAAAVAPDGGRIAFVTRSDGLPPGIVVARRDGSDPHVVTRGPGVDNRPEWSPDSTRIVFVSDRAGDRDLYVMRDDGTEVRPLVADAGDDSAAAWSPDGRWIAWSHVDDAGFEIRVVGADGGAPRAIVHQPAVGPHMGSPSWSPDSTHITFAGADLVDGSDVDIEVVDLDGSDLRSLTDDHVPDLDPNFGPDGSIQFVRFGDLWLLPSDGGPARRVTRWPEEEYLVDWSSDGADFVVTANAPASVADGSTR